MTVRAPIPEDLERQPVPEDAEAVVGVAPPAAARTPAEWFRRNLFSSWFNGLLTVVTAVFLGWVLFQLARWVFVRADWTVFRAGVRSYMVGRFPLEETWRVWSGLFLVVSLAGLTRGAFTPPARPTARRLVARAVAAGVGVLLVLYLAESVTVWVLSAAAAGVFLAGSEAGRRIGADRLRRPLILAWILQFPLVLLLLRGFGGVPALYWGGFVMNLLMAQVAIFASFPIGILLALGRRSTLPAVAGFSVGFIELIRGVPLVTLLLFGEFVLPLLLPPGFELASLFRAAVMFTIFSAAYVAEIVRGGLQGVPQGQYDAGRALGLSPTRMTALVVLPQALRSTIPAMIGHFISLFKDTTLLSVLVGASELLDSARRAPRAGGFEFIGDVQEALLPAALIFWIVAFSMSRWSQRLERRVGLGER